MQKLIVVGLDVYFADSFLWFAERGISVTVLTQTSSPACFAKNAALYADMGFRVLRYTPEDFYSGNFRIEELGLDRETLILAGPNFEGDSSRLIVDLDDSTFYDLWLLQALAGYNQQHACGAMLVRFHNGDTGFGSQEMAELYALALRDVDLLLFDNDLLRDFVFANCPTLSGKKSRLSWLENPLKRHVRQGEGRGVDFICLGRFICGHRLHIPVLHFPLAEAGRYEGLAGPVRPLYDLSIGTSLAALASERAAFARDLRGTVFGLDHLGGAFNGGFEIFARNKDFFFSLAGQQCGLCGEPRELYYHACNCSSKIASYLMFGIIPVIPHSLSTVYSDLLNKGMAVQVKEPGDLVRLTKMPLAEIEEYRKNIYASADLFTFGSQAERLLEEFEKFQAETWEQTACPDSDSQDGGGGGSLII